MKHVQIAALAALAVVVAQPASAVVMSGGIDPVQSLTQAGAYILNLAGIIIPIIAVMQGIKAVADGRHLGPIVFAALGGTVFCFGFSYFLTRIGVA